MDTPGSVSDLLSEVTGRTVRETVSARNTLRSYLDSSVDTNRAYLAVWNALQRAGLNATFSFQNALIQASQTLFDLGLLPRPASNESGSQPRRLWPDATLKLTARGARIIPGVQQPATPEVESGTAKDWAESALRFQGPFGIEPNMNIGGDDDA